MSDAVEGRRQSAHFIASMNMGLIDQDARGVLQGVAVVESPPKGRHVVATKHFKAGSLVLKESPYACVLNDESIAQRCDFCLGHGTDLLLCGRSKLARYCSREHQRAAWSQGYKEECAALVAMAPRIPPATLRLAARIAWRAHREAKSGTAAGAAYSGWAGVMGLVSHWDSLEPGRKALYASMATAARMFIEAGLGMEPSATAPLPAEMDLMDLDAPTSHTQPVNSPSAAAADCRLPVNGGEQLAASHPVADGVCQSPMQPSCGPGATTQPSSQPLISATGVDNTVSTSPSTGTFVEDTNLGLDSLNLPTVRSLAHLLSRLACNAHTICDAELRSIGTGCYSMASMANHSCQPSCMQSFKGKDICFRALRDIHPGEEVTIAYVELAATRQQRREALCEQYFFDLDAPDSTAPPCHQGAVGELRLSQLRPHPLVDVWAGPGGVTPVWIVGDGEAKPEPPSMLSAAMHALGPPGSLQTPPATPMDVRVRVYGVQAQPPWPADLPKDTKLTELLLVEEEEGRVTQHSSNSNSVATKAASRAGCELPWLSSLGVGRGTPLQGGLQARMGTLGEGGGESDAAGSFAGMAEGEDDDDGGGHSRAAASGALGQGKVHPPRHSHQLGGSSHAVAEVDMWGPWVAATAAQYPATGHTTTQASNPGAAAAPASTDAPQLCALAVARAVGGLVRTQRQAQALADAGRHGAAADVLLSALKNAGALRVPVVWGHERAGSMAAAMPPSQQQPGQQQRAQREETVVVALGPCHGVRMALCQAALKALIDEGTRWQMALEVARVLVPVYDLAYPEVWPNRGLHYATLTKLAMFLERPAEAATAADKALAVLKTTHAGEGSAVCEEVARIRWEAGQELAAGARA